MSRQIYLDMEFISSDTSNRGLVSIGLVDDAGREYYAVNAEHDYAAVQAHPWMREHVWPSLPRTGSFEFDLTHPDVRPLDQIRAEVAEFFDGPERAELCAWFGTQDHYRLLGLWGHDWQEMPRQIPKVFTEIWHTIDVAGLAGELPEHDGDVHHALADARYARTLHQHAERTSSSRNLACLEDTAELSRYRTANERGTLFRIDGSRTRGELFAGELGLLRSLAASLRTAVRQDDLDSATAIIKQHDEQAAAALEEQQRRDGCTRTYNCACPWCAEAEDEAELQDTKRPAPFRGEPVVRPTSYEVCYLPDDSPKARAYTLTVSDVGDGRWAVRHQEAYLSAHGAWEHSPASIGKTWLEARSWDRSTALALARVASYSVTVDGIAASTVRRRITSTHLNP